MPDSFMGLTTGQLSEYISADCCGLLGADVLGKFDIIFHQPAGKMTLTSEIMQGTEEEVIFLEDCLGIPIIKVNIDRAEYRMYLDTGAQFSYLQNDSLVEYPVVDTVEDFFPGYGTFEIDLHEVTTSIGDKSYDLKLGKLPDNLVAILSLAGVQGIIGNEIFMRRTTNYYPRRGKILFRD
ncbi:MAG: hypothetical protein OXD01_03040 [Gammaproteobacteria bacterium]|nr:hypothetical protein [Gammaproteobacteria bacterium]